jgi:TPR repeat protein
MSSWQGIEIDANLRQLAERAANRAGVPVEQWIERAIRRAYPAAFQAPQPAPPMMPPRNSFNQAPQHNGNGIDQSLAELIAVARAPRQPAAPRPEAQPHQVAVPPEAGVSDSHGSILDHVSQRRRRAAGAALPKQGWSEEQAPEPYGNEPDEMPRHKPRRLAPEPHPAYEDDGEPDFSPAPRRDARAPWPSFKSGTATAEDNESDFDGPLELTRPLRAKRSRKPLMIAVAVAMAVSLGALGAQRIISMMAGPSEPQDQTALNSDSSTMTPPPSPMLAPQPVSPPADQSPALPPAVQMTPPDQTAAQTAPPAPTAAPYAPPSTAYTAPAVTPTMTPPSVNVAPPMPPPVAYNQPATSPPQSPAVADTASKPSPAPPAVTEPLPQRKVAAVRPPAATTPATAKKPVPGDAPQDPAQLAAWLQERVKTNDPVAEYRLGVLYALGQGVKQDYGHAAQLFQAAADGGVAEAQYNVAVMYSEGMGVPKDPAQSVKWYQKAAAQGNANAAFNLGVAYSNGAGVQQDIQEAARWFRRAASAGVVNAQFNLGLLYERGEGVPQSSTEAYAWYAAAAAHGDQGAAQRRDHLASSLPPAELQKAQDRATELQKTIQTGASPATVDQKANAAKP